MIHSYIHLNIGSSPVNIYYISVPAHTHRLCAPAVRLVGTHRSLLKLSSVEVISVNKMAFNLMVIAKVTRQSQIFS
ncbi:hypothetical protein ABIC74_004294 [Mucilaginibacter rubeus]|jgi:hypothetical protein